MQKLKKIVRVFSPYATEDEKSVQVFYKSLTENSNREITISKLLELIQYNLACMNLWGEYRYKGYQYLTKSNRANLYNNLKLIEIDFENFSKSNTDQLSPLNDTNYQTSTKLNSDSQQLVLLSKIMAYFSLTRGLYKYQESSSFGKLLQDPSKNQLIGDCNQIVTLYIYIYSRYFPVTDLKLRTLPNHIALHYNGVDIEATKGIFTDYSNDANNSILPIEEIVSINLLDVTDSYLKTKPISPKELLQASRLAYLLSSNREIVANNLQATYSLIINDLIKLHSYDSALTFANQSKNQKFLELVGHNGAVYNMQKHNFTKARSFAKFSSNKQELIKHTYQVEGKYYYEKGNYYASIKAFSVISDQKSINTCYEALFIKEQSKLPKNLDSSNIKNYRKIIDNMNKYAKKSNNKTLLSNVSQYNKYL